MRTTASRRIGLVAVLALVSAIFGLGYLKAQGIRPPINPPRNPPIIRPPVVNPPFTPPVIKPPVIPPFNPNVGNTKSIYTCSRCNRQVSESSLSCPFCSAKFTNVGPDGKPLPGTGGFNPGFNPNPLPKNPPQVFNPPPNTNPPQVSNPNPAPNANPPQFVNAPVADPPQAFNPNPAPNTNPPQVVNAPVAPDQAPVAAQTASNGTALAITIGIVAGLLGLVVIGGGTGLVIYVLKTNSKSDGRKSRRRERYA